MSTTFAERACECLRAAHGKPLKAREIAEWIVAHGPTEVHGDEGPGNEAEAIRRLTAQIAASFARWQELYPELRATDGKPRRYFWQPAEPVAAAEDAVPEPTGDTADGHTAPLHAVAPLSPAKASRLRFVLDRAAVLYIGIVVGVLIGLSFHANGKPFAALFGGDDGAAGVERVAALPPAQGCTDNFPMSPRVIAALRANRPINIGVFGDSFGDGVYAGAVQHLHGRDDFKVFQFSREATGFTRYASLNLLDDARRKIDGQTIDIALINFGTNDTQGVWADGKASSYMSASWQKVIGDRAAALVDLFQKRGIAVGWIGLPRMRDAKFDSQIQLMNGFYAGLMCRLHVPFVNPVAASEDAHHQFSKELIDRETGQTYLGRADDGIHMTVHGYRVIAAPLLQRIDALVPEAQAGP